ncbi:uncharacterized protein LY89DRAFT_687766 [Mollisia scopiformis]|uniref:Uncharacterized protein n=1 Tax=Mollisia scopiformis TaxID=149040 RepID=A0A194WYY8_MOLSC|nr:uncharacterized protein LY89DRAFT_687766 [Mollisia scopiformis]KUJ12807.1 hypothetical protein LY89DRAFT_687766 [Mollisia scopiformis]
MRLKGALYILTNFAAASLADDVFNCTSLGPKCEIVQNGTSGIFACNCIADSDQPHLADFYTNNFYKGFLWRGYGAYGSCNNLPLAWQSNTNSIISANDPPAVCCVYTDLDCNTDGHAWLQLNGDGTVQDVIFPYDGTQSYQCSLLVDEYSLCTDDA